METSSDSGRLPRFRRHRARKPTFVLQPRDIQIVKLVAEHRVISSADIQLLIDGSDQAILRRLQRLFHHSILDRPRSQKQFGNGRMVYALGHRGAELLTLETGQQFSSDWSEKNRQLKVPYLEHALMISRFHAALQYACNAAGTVLLERWFGDGAIRDAVHVDGERIPIAPDAMFILNVIEGRNPGRVHCFLEADRGTMWDPLESTCRHASLSIL